MPSQNMVPFNDTYDALLVLHDGAAAVTADGAGQVSSAAKILDFEGSGTLKGPSTPAVSFWGVALIDITALDSTTGDEIVDILIQVSSSPSFASDIVNVAQLRVGNSTVGGQDVDYGVGRYVLPFTNYQVGATRRYGRVYFDVGGTTPSITAVIRACPMRRH